ncbi:hypothetical protein NEL77_01485 [Escherichia coli]|nr:hypothetical protein [Escherichia coli]ELU2631265.1 hypothetical protein [Escherichia coli]MDI0829607.1 hypothetical protein [Escherichia coli]
MGRWWRYKWITFHPSLTPDKNVDDICRSVLKKHRETVTLMGFTPTHLSLAIGMLNGVFKER